MKEQVVYQCEICNKEYSDSFVAELCEKRHRRAEIAETIYEPWSKLPDCIYVKDPDNPSSVDFWVYEQVYWPTTSLKRILYGLNPFRKLLWRRKK